MAHSATAQSMVLNKPKIPIVPTTKEEEITYVTLTRSNVGAGNEKRKASVPWVQKEDVELILRLVKDYKDTWPAGRLGLNTGALRFEHFRQCLGGSVRDDWDAARDGLGTTMADFDTGLELFIAKYILPTELADQHRYLHQIKKPFRLRVADLATHLKFINTLMRYLPLCSGR